MNDEFTEDVKELGPICQVFISQCQCHNSLSLCYDFCLLSLSLSVSLLAFNSVHYAAFCDKNKKRAVMVLFIFNI
jgi:hypothetical protein